MFHPVFKYILGIYLIGMGFGNFFEFEEFIRVVPSYIPYPGMMIWVTGIFEILGGIGLLLPSTSRLMAIVLLVLFAAVFPANLHMAMSNIPGEGFPVPSWIMWAKIPIQIVLIGWAIWMVQGGDNKVSSKPL